MDDDTWAQVATADADFMRWINQNARATTTRKIPAKVKDPIETATDDVLILELVKRGYAVGKLDGQAG